MKKYIFNIWTGELNEVSEIKFDSTRGLHFVGITANDMDEAKAMAKQVVCCKNCVAECAPCEQMVFVGECALFINKD